MLSGCFSSGGERKLERELPAYPKFARPAVVPNPKPGERMIVIAARERAGRLEANATIVEFVAWYKQVQAAYAGGQAP